MLFLTFKKLIIIMTLQRKVMLNFLMVLLMINSICHVIKLFRYVISKYVVFFSSGDTCCLSFSLGYVKSFLEKQIPGVYVLSLRIGNSTIEDYENGYFMCPNKQVKYVCNKLRKNPLLRNGFNAIGFSQGGQFL